MLIDTEINGCSDMRREVLNASYENIVSDKGNKKGFNHLVKMLAWWGEESGRVKKWTLDIDVTGNTSTETADSIDQSLQKVNMPKK